MFVVHHNSYEGNSLHAIFQNVVGDEDLKRQMKKKKNARGKSARSASRHLNRSRSLSFTRRSRSPSLLPRQPMTNVPYGESLTPLHTSSPKRSGINSSR